MATMETFVADKWVELAKGKDLFSKADKAGVPIRVVHPNGNFKVIRNAEKLPEAVATTSTKPKAVEEKLEAAHKRANKIIAKAIKEAVPDEERANKIIAKAMAVDPAMVGA
jgi:lambda repressor-like predicted transcriptional regulator